MPTLLEIQRAVARSLIAGDGAAAVHVRDDGLDPARRLAVYRHTVAANLSRALGLNFPAVRRLVGAEFFDGAARGFIAAEPPRSACLDDYHPGFAEFLARFAPAASLPYLAGVARLEWAVSRALHAPDAAALDPARLAALDPDSRGRVAFAPHPSVGLVEAAHPVDAIWRAVLARDDEALAAIDPGAGPVRLLVLRREDGVAVARLEDAAWRLTASLCAGIPLQAALDGAPPDAPALLAAYLAGGLFADFTLAGPMETAA
jgi:hypothetical protein